METLFQALDYLAIGIHELAAISERRIERLCNPSLSELPAFLVAEGGLNSGFMIAHCTAAALGKDTAPFPEHMPVHLRVFPFHLEVSNVVCERDLTFHHFYLHPSSLSAKVTG